MSKKMLKRSLALGALMAFVITGSAMAAELTINYDNGTYTATGTGISDVVTATTEDGLHKVLGEVGWSDLYSGANAITNKNSYMDNTVNEITINGGTYYNQIIGDKSIEGDSSNNVVIARDATIGSKIYVATTTKANKIGNANNNRLEVYGSTINGNLVTGKDYTGLAAAVSEYGNVENNIIIVNDNSNIMAEIWGGTTMYGNAISNKVTVNDSIVDGFIVAGDASNGYANRNELNINGKTTKITGPIMGGRAQYGDDGTANNNTVTINDGEIIGNIYGGAGNGVEGNGNSDATYSETNGNTVNIVSGTINGSVYGGNNGNVGVANENTVNITGGTINKEVYGGFAKDEANDNTINISGGSFGENASVFGSNLTTSTGNTLNIGDDWSGNIKSVKNFNTVNFGKGSSVTTNNVALGSGATINLADGDAYTGGNYAINGALTVNSENATLTIGNIKEATYNIASDYEGGAEWTLDSNLMKVAEDGWKTDGVLQVTTVAKEAGEIAKDLGVSDATGDFLSNLGSVASGSGVDEKLVGLANAANNSKNPVVVTKAVEALQKMAEAGGNSATAANVVTNVTGVTNQRLSLSNGNHGGNKGGHGVGLLEEGSGAAIWAQYVHGKDEVDGMHSTVGASSYEGQYNGIVMGVDFKKVGKFQSGIAFNYVEGDTNSVGTTSPTRSDYDFWGIGYYGNIRNADSNVIFDIGYAKTDSDVTTKAFGYDFEASPETTTWTAGVKVEKLYQNNNVAIVPYTGLRYMSIDPDDYSTKCGILKYDMERQDIWLLPLGVSIKQEIVNPNGWVVTPKFDLSYIWAFGDTDSTMQSSLLGTDNRPIGYDVMDEGSWMGLVGVEAAMDDWTFGVSYSYQKGDHSESKKFYVDAKYSF